MPKAENQCGITALHNVRAALLLWVIPLIMIATDDHRPVVQA